MEDFTNSITHVSSISDIFFLQYILFDLSRFLGGFVFPRYIIYFKPDCLYLTVYPFSQELSWNVEALINTHIYI